MGLSRLDNFLNSPRGTIFYVDVNALDSTDSIENRGTSQARPFRTIQRALAEVSRYSYQRGKDNDRFSKSTVIVAPGTYFIDNRPGAIVKDNGDLVLRNSASYDMEQWNLDTNFDLGFDGNVLYPLNSVYGGVILPRGCSLIGMDLRKCKIVPLYVPDPEEDQVKIDRSAVFRVTGACFCFGFTILDADPNGNCYKDYTRNLFVPNYSHHKLTVFEYADGVNPVVIDDDLQQVTTSTTDLEMYYAKIAKVYGDSSGRNVPDAIYPGGIIDIQPVVDEYRMVGSRGKEVGITSIRAGDGTIPSTTITVDLEEEILDLSVDSPIQISGINNVPGYDGQFVVSNILSSKTIQYRVQNAPLNALPLITGAKLNLSVDTITSASPYIFNCSLRSVYGMCGLHADGSKADGFKSMVLAQYTGIGLQKDDKAFALYDRDTGTYNGFPDELDLHSNSRSQYKPEYINYHVKASNNAFLQLVSIFAIGYAQHFLCESGGDMSITNSNSNFGGRSLVSSGYQSEAFRKDDVGYITHIIPPQELESEEINVEFLSIDVSKTINVSTAVTTRLYLYDQTDLSNPPESVFDGYRIGSKPNEKLYVQIFANNTISEYVSTIVIPDTNISEEKSFDVIENENDTLTFSTSHTFKNGESIRVISKDGHLPDGLVSTKIYYAITSESSPLLSTQIKLAQTLNAAILGESEAIDFPSKGGDLTVVSRVSDKKSGEIGHPIQWDISKNNWYISVASLNNQIYDIISNVGVLQLGSATSRTYIKRRSDNRNSLDTLYRFRYVIPADAPVIARPPSDGFIIQESSVNAILDSDIPKYFSNSEVIFSKSTDIRNPRYISNTTWESEYVTVTTDLPHELSIGTVIEINNVSPNGYNGKYIVTDILNSRQFKYYLTPNPGIFVSNTTTRDENLPIFRKSSFSDTYQIYRTQEIQEYILGKQDGVYHLILINCSNSPTVDLFSHLKFSQPLQYLYPQINRDNPKSDPEQTISFASPDPIGQVVINNPEYSLTKETLEKTIRDFGVGFGITSIVSNNTGVSHTIFTKIDHGLSGITSAVIINAGQNYLPGNYYAAEVVGFAGSTTGSNASVRVYISDLNNGIGSITSVQIMHGGSAYGIGNTLQVIPAAGTGTGVGFVPATIQVTAVSNDSEDAIRISGVGGTYSGYNTVYKIDKIVNEKQLNLTSVVPISGFSTVSIASTIISKNTDAYVVRTGKFIPISIFNYSAPLGIATIGFSTSHGLSVNNKILLSGFTEPYFNSDVIVKRLNSLEEVVVSIGKDGGNLLTSGSNRGALRNGYASNAGNISPGNENIGGRMIAKYAGSTSYLLDTLETTSSEDTLVIANAITSGFKIGDYLQINDEIFRIKSTVTNNQVEISRSLLGTKRQTHQTNDVVRKIKIIPVELRRNSIIRASGHTFEYVGYGPGNYSTALPDRQDRILSAQEEILTQATREDGGIVNFTGMNSDGDFYTGNTKINASTGEEELYDAPIQTTRGEELVPGILNAGFNVISPVEANITRALRVEGGPENNIISQFDGPVVFNNKVTSYSDLESTSLYLQGGESVSRRISIISNTPDFAGNYGDIEFNTRPKKLGNAGWIYTLENEWQPWGFIGGPGVGIASNGNYVGFATVVNIETIGFNLSSKYNSATGIATVTFDANPRIGISTGPQNSLVGIVTQLNFIGSGVTISGSVSSGIATVEISLAGIGSTVGPGKPYNSLQFNDGGGFGGVDYASWDNLERVLVFGNINSYYANDIDDAIIFNNTGYIGFGTDSITSKIDIYTKDQRALYINALYGGEIVRIENGFNDIKPFIIDGAGNVGINTISAISPLDVNGIVSVAGTIRIYEGDRTNYIGFRVGNLNSNLTYTLPNTYGINGQVLSSNGSGGLAWATFTGGNIVNAGFGITISYSGQNATITNNGVRRIIAGSGITISPTSGTNEVTINAVPANPTNLYPYTTRGFSMPI
jgi:hypothetical protein